MALALSAYLSVLWVSSKLAADGVTLAIITVLQLPPIESFRSRVSLESRYGTNFLPSASALMQLPVCRTRQAKGQSQARNVIAIQLQASHIGVYATMNIMNTRCRRLGIEQTLTKNRERTRLVPAESG